MVEDDISFVDVKDDIGVTSLCSLAETIWYEFFPSIISMAQIEYMLGKFLSKEAIEKDMRSGCRYFLCKDGREYVGFIAVQPKLEMSTAGGGRRLFLSKLYLTQEYRGVHLCSKMMKKVQAEAKASDCQEIFLTVNKYNSHAIDVYYHYGFREEKAVQTDIGGGFVMDDYVMSCKTDDLKV
ncbi:MAG: GNAT family N-acetyltransferase [Succinivibrionaceae bacterium]|nr:GNAT family N-acetyltransferase [Succinivibrionaceae bacterium]